METGNASRGSDFRQLRNCPEEVEVPSQVVDQLVPGGSAIILRNVDCLSGVPTAKKARNGVIVCEGECARMRNTA